MIFPKFLIAALAIAQYLRAASVDDSFVPTENKPYNFKIEYSIAGKQESVSDFVDVTNGDKVSLDYTFYNGEDQEVSVVGVGGSFNDPRTGLVRNNITLSQLGPVQIASGESANFTQHIGVDVVPDDYLVVPSIYLVYNSSMIVLGSRSQLVKVEDAAISFFNPQLLFLELVLLGTLGVAAYYAYEIFGKQYLRSNQPIKVATVKKLVPADRTSSPASASGASADSWLPKSHLKTTKLKRT